MTDPTGITRFATRGRNRLAYELVPASDPDAPAVLLLHGLLAGRGEWAPQRAALAGRVVLLLPEARGHGASAAVAQGSPDRRYAVADLAADTLAVLDHAGLDRVHVVGHGLGGATAWELAAVAPERLRSLTLVEPDLPALLDGDLDPLAGSARREARQVDRAAADAADRDQTDQALDAYLGPRRGADWRDRLARAEQAAVRRHAAALAPLLTALDAHAPDPRAAASVAPILVVHGSAARPLARLICRRLAAIRPDARLETVATASPVDGPLAGAAGDALSNLLLAFLSDPDTTEPPPRSGEG